MTDAAPRTVLQLLRPHRAEPTAAGTRGHLLVLPSVICTTLVARNVARRTNAISIAHQDGCGHIGDDVEHSLDLFAALAINPNVTATLVLSLGCETVQGVTLAKRIAQRDGVADLIRLQDYGAAAVEEVAVDRIIALRSEHGRDRHRYSPEVLRIGVLADRGGDVVERFIALCAAQGAPVIVTGVAAATVADATTAMHVSAATANATQRLTSLAAAGASMIVSFPAEHEPPQSLALCPTLTVASESTLHTDIADDFDLSAGADPVSIWSLLAEVAEGAPTTAERLGLDDFSLPRLRRTM